MHVLAFNHKVGLNLHPGHYKYLEPRPTTHASWLEVPTEFHLEQRGYPLEILKKMRQDYPLALHGDAMNVGSPEGVSLSYLQRLKNLIERVEPFIVSDHLCWTGTSDMNLHEFLPLPFTEDSIVTIANNIDFAQNFLRRPLVFENISTFISFRTNEMTEWDFIKEIANRTGCGLLLNINNMYINALSYGFDPHYLLNHLPTEQIAQVHIGGSSLDKNVPDHVWNLLKVLAPQVRHLPVLIEQYNETVDFQTLEREILQAVYILENYNEAERSTESV